MKEYFHLKEYGLRQLIREFRKRADESQLFNHSAKLAYFFLLSLFPLLLFFMMAVGRVLSTAKDVQQQLTHYLQTILPAAASGLIEESVRQMSKDSSSIWASFALIFTWWSATQGMVAVIEAMNLSYRVKESRTWWKKYLVASGLTLLILILNVLTLLMITYGGALSHRMSSIFGLTQSAPIIWNIIQWSMLLFFLILSFNLVYRYAPNLNKKGQWFTPGIFMGVGLWILGAFIILMLWLYISGMTLLIGGLINSILRKSPVNGTEIFQK